MHRLLIGGALTALAVLVAPSPAAADAAPLIPRQLLFGNPERAYPQLSPDGKRVAWLQPDANNVLQVWVKTVGGSDDKTVTADKKRGIRRYFWAENNRTLIYLQDADGDENWHLYGVDLPSGNVRDYTAFAGVRAEPQGTSPRFPNTLLVALNVRDRQVFDVWRLDLETGALQLDTQNPGDVVGWVADDSYAVRVAQAALPDGGSEIRWRADGKSPWRSLLKVGPEEEINAVDFTLDGQALFLTTSVGADTGRLVVKTLASGAEKELARSDDVDVGDVLMHPTRHVAQAVAFVRGRQQWQVLDPSVKDDFAGIGKLAAGDFDVVNRDLADKTWLVGFTLDRGSMRWFAWDRAAKKGTLLFSARPKLDAFTLAEMKATEIVARDRLKLPAYLTVPAGVAPRGLPLVLLVHGGPWARDTWGLDPMAQWLANRGYAVLQVNYRGSTGFGKKFLHAADRQWGKKMHDDLIDAVGWAVKEGIADPKRVAIYGGSYGGYAALAGAAFTPDAFRCAVDIVGPSNLTTLVHSIPPYWAPMRAMFDQRVGNVDDPKDAQLIHDASPLFSAQRIKIPLLIGQGANDPRVKQAESEQIVAAIEKSGGSATYVLYPDEGHGFQRPDNRIDFNARAEKFLAAHLGGRLEKLDGGKVSGSTAVVREIAGKAR